jgi:HemK-like putative methylase
MHEITFDGLTLVGLPGRVMTPRPTSEPLVAAARARVGDRPARIADVGTGSGALAVAIALACPRAEVWASDTSAAAALLACVNAHRHGVADRVHVRRGDLLSPLPGRFDVVVANLPYVPASAAAAHPDLAAEPFEAVFAPGDGLDGYRRLVDDAAGRLADAGVLLLQLDRRLVARERGELPALQAALETAPRTDEPRAAWVAAIAAPNVSIRRFGFPRATEAWDDRAA